MATWPASLPQYLEVGSTETQQNNIIRSQPSIGPPKQRRRFTAVAREIEGTMLIDAAQRATLDTFYETTVAAVGSFDFIDPKDGSTQQFRFTRPPAYEFLVGGGSGVAQTRVTLNLEKLP